MRLTTDQILRLPPFNLNDEELAEFMWLVADTNLTTNKFLYGEVYKPTDNLAPENKVPYTDAQVEEIAADVVLVHKLIFADKKPSPGAEEYNFTCGAPLVGKTVFARQQLSAADRILLDIEAEILPHMQCYKNFIKALEVSKPNLKDLERQKLAYEFFRDASNYLCNLFLLWAIYNKYKVTLAGVASDKRVVDFILPALKARGYKIKTHVLMASPKARNDACVHRKNTLNYYQSTPVEGKGRVAKVLSIIDDFIPLVDTMDLYWNSGNYWMCKSIDESNRHLMKFASYDRSKDPTRVVGNPMYEKVLRLLYSEIQLEFPEDHERRTKLSAMFKSWFAKPEYSFRDYLPAFNTRNLLIASTFVGMGMVAVASARKHKIS